MKLNLGSFTERFSGYLNVDKDPGFNPDILCDIEEGIPVDDNSVSEIKAVKPEDAYMVSITYHSKFKLLSEVLEEVNAA